MSLTAALEPVTLEGRELTDWLESPEGEEWSRARHRDKYGHWAKGEFGEIKEDHPRETCDPQCWADLFAPLDGVIRRELEMYGMNGLPPVR